MLLQVKAQGQLITKHYDCTVTSPLPTMMHYSDAVLPLLSLLLQLSLLLFAAAAAAAALAISIVAV